MKDNKKIALMRVCFFTVAGLTLLASLFVAASYPTAKHVEVAKQLNSGPEEKVFNSLMNTPETLWTNSVGFASIVIQFIMFIAVAHFTYRYVRKHRLSKNAAGVTTGILTVAGVISGFISMVMPVAYGVISAMFTIGGIAFITVGNLIASFIIAFIVSSIAERRYDRKHSFAVE